MSHTWVSHSLLKTFVCFLLWSSAPCDPSFERPLAPWPLNRGAFVLCEDHDVQLPQNQSSDLTLSPEVHGKFWVECCKTPVKVIRWKSQCWNAVQSVPPAWSWCWYVATQQLEICRQLTQSKLLMTWSIRLLSEGWDQEFLRKTVVKRFQHFCYFYSLLSIKVHWNQTMWA